MKIAYLLFIFYLQIFRIIKKITTNLEKSLKVVIETKSLSLLLCIVN